MNAAVQNRTVVKTRSYRRRGMVLIVILVVFAIAMGLFAIWARSALDEQQQTVGREHLMQAERLAESGLDRAVARHAADEKYTGETWSVPADELGGRHAAEVRIRVSPGADANQTQFEATAEFPTGAVRRAQITKRLDVANPTTGNES